MTTAIDTAHSLVPLPARPRLSYRHIIFTNGPSLTLKTTLAKHLGEQLRIPVRGTFQYDTVLTDGDLDDQKRLGRYAPLFEDARDLLASGASVILDGNFGDPVRRAGVWKLAREFDTRVIAIRTACDDPNLIRERARRRAADPTAPDHGVGYAAYLLTQAEVLANPLEHDREFWELGVEVIEFRTGATPFVLCTPDAHADTLLIASILEESGLLASSLASATPRAHAVVCRTRRSCPMHPVPSGLRHSHVTGPSWLARRMGSSEWSLRTQQNTWSRRTG